MAAADYAKTKKSKEHTINSIVEVESKYVK
jgi:hypothetical protein